MSLDLLTRRDAFRLEMQRLWGSEAQFDLTGPPGAGFVVQVTTNMANWTPILTNSIPPQGWYPCFDSGSSGLPISFYRAVQLQPSPPLILVQPKSQTVLGEASVTFDVIANSAWPLSYQWQKNNSPIGGATNATLTFTNANALDSASYLVTVANLNGSVNSSNAILNVVVSANDMFARRILIPGMTNIATGSNAGATKEPGEPNPTGYAAGKSVWWAWTAPVDGLVTVSAQGSPSLKTVLAVYTGNSVSALSNVASAISVTTTSAAEVSFVVKAGKTYQISVDGVVGGYSSSSGIILSLAEVPAGPPSITTQPQSQTVASGANVTFSVVATSPWPINYQWQKNNNAIGDATNAVLTLTNVQTGDSGSYKVTVANAYGSLTSSNATLAVVTIPNDAFANRIVISGMTNTMTGANIGAPRNPENQITPLMLGVRRFGGLGLRRRMEP